MKNVFIIGSQGYNKNYGGWETFVKNFCDYANKEKFSVYVTEISSDKKEKEYISNDIHCLPVYTLLRGSVRMMMYSIKALFSAIRYIKKNELNNSIIYILGLRQGPFLWLLKPYLKKHNIKIYLNPDGLEWRRSKWNKLIKMYFLYCEKTMLKNCDGIICDSKGIKSYIEERYTKNKVEKHFIAYGTKEVDLSDIDEKEVLDSYELKKDDYCLIVGRCVPENNYELIIKEFMKSSINKKLIIISNINGSKYYEDLKEKTNCDSDKRIRILSGIYDEKKLSVIRKNAYLYLHGHSVGGTNPSLLEALRFTDLNVLFDINFNKEVGLDSCLYFTKEEENLKNLLDDEENLNQAKKELGKKAKKRIEDEYTWEYVMNKYEKVFGGK